MCVGGGVVRLLRHQNVDARMHATQTPTHTASNNTRAHPTTTRAPNTQHAQHPTQVAKFLASDSEVGAWVLQGLPTDELSVQNAIMVTRASR